MSKLLRPMLAEDATDKLDKIKYPIFVSAKLDGVRATIRNGQVISRSGKLIPNKQIQVLLGGNKALDLCDGELIHVSAAPNDVFRKTTSLVMAEDANAGEIRFSIFDQIKDTYYQERIHEFYRANSWEGPGWELVEQRKAKDLNDLLFLEDYYLKAGNEGIILRDPLGKYKHGRSTFNEGLLLKVKRFTDEEGTIVGFFEMYSNLNPSFKDELGHTKRSSKKEGLVPLGQLGYLEVKSIKTGVISEVGTGFNNKERIDIWNSQHLYKDKIVKFKYFKHGSYNKPRHPVFLGFRDKRDMSCEKKSCSS